MKALLDGTEIELPDPLASLSLYNYGVYTSLAVTNGKVKGFERHIGRLEQSARQFLGVALEPEAIRSAIRQFIAGRSPDRSVTARVTVFPKAFSLGAPQDVSDAHILVTGSPGSSVGANALRLSLHACYRPNAEFKVTNVSAAMHLRARSKRHGFDDALMHVGGIISEGPTWNIFFARNGKLFTPRTTDNILPGITRALLLEESGLDVEETAVGAEDLRSADAAFVTNAAIGVSPVLSIEDTIFNPESDLLDEVRQRYRSIADTSIF